MARPTNGGTPAKPSSRPKLRAVAPLPPVAPTGQGEMPQLVAALLSLVTTWRPQLREPAPVALLRGVEALLGAVSGWADGPGRELVPVTSGPVVGLRTTPEVEPANIDGLPDDELRAAVAEDLLFGLQELSDLERLVDDMDADLGGSVFGTGGPNVDRYVRDLRRALRGVRSPLVGMSKALLGTDIDHSLVTHARNLASYVDGGRS
jgi:hypothetical protein